MLLYDISTDTILICKSMKNLSQVPNMKSVVIEDTLEMIRTVPVSALFSKILEFFIVRKYKIYLYKVKKQVEKQAFLHFFCFY
jgi:hypothetical protein